MSSSSTHCVDANLAVCLVGPAQRSAVDRRWHVWEVERPRLVAPTLFRYEVVNALHRSVQAGLMGAEAAARALTQVHGLPVEMHGDEALHERALELAAELSLPAAYDAHYLALAERFGAPLWTTDAKLANAVGDGRPEVRLVQ
jgi:predicted nucleic acid-binding protein